MVGVLPFVGSDYTVSLYGSLVWNRLWSTRKLDVQKTANAVIKAPMIAAVTIRFITFPKDRGVPLLPIPSRFCS
jgi:hypothetical protein